MKQKINQTATHGHLSPCGEGPGVRPILYSTPMVQAKLAGLKTQTRRIIPEAIGWDPVWRVVPAIDSPGRFCMRTGSQYSLPYFKPRYGQPGDILWTRETWAKNEQDGQFDYRADYASEDHFYKWKPGIHMPFAACRSFDVITAIRAERIMDISAEDAIAEGIDRHEIKDMEGTPSVYKFYGSDDDDNVATVYTGNTILSYRSLWQYLNGTPKPIQKKINGKLVTTGYIAYPWGDALSLQPYEGLTTWRGKPLTVVPNPWVWVVEFRPCTNDEIGLIKYA